MDLFSLYVLFSHFRPRDVTLGNCFFQLSSYARAYVCITYEKTKASRGLKWENKTYKLKRSIAKTAFITARIIASLEIMIAKYKAVRTYNEEHGPQRRNTRSFFRESSSHHLIMCPLNEEKVVKEWNILSFVVFVIYKAPIFFFCKLKR